MTKQQQQTVNRIKRIDPQAKLEEVGEQLFATYTPAWEKGRHSNGEYRLNPNPQPITFYVHTDGRLFGWGYGNESKVPVKLNRPITTKVDMAEALKVRSAARKPEAKTEAAKVEELPPKTEPKSTTRKTRTSTRKTAKPTA